MHISHMLLNITSLFSGFLFLFLILLMVINPIKSNKRNIYLMLIFFISGYHRFSNGFNILNFTQSDYTLLNNKPVFSFFIIPIYYLFFCRLVMRNFEFRKELLHFIFPTILFIINIRYVNLKYYKVVFVFYCTVYLIMLLKKLKYFYFTKNPTILEKINNKIIKKWLFLMLFLSVISLSYLITLIFFNNSSQVITKNYLKYSSLFWFIPFVYIFSNPVLIFGQDYLLKNLKKVEARGQLIWNIDPIKPIEDKDGKFYNSISNKIFTIITNIESLQNLISIISKKTLNTKIISEELNIPKKHVDFIFKYHCHYSVNDFSNLIKINYALILIKEGYLKEYTVEALGEKCLFKSRYTFSQNFKKFVGTSVREFTKTSVNNLSNISLLGND